MKHFAIEVPGETGPLVRHLRLQLKRERTSRLEAEALAERGLRELYESQVRLALLQRITDCANCSSDFVSVLELTLKEVCHHMDWDFGNAYRVGSDGTANACDTWFAADPDQLSAFVEVSRHIVFKHGSCLPGRVLRDAHPHWIDNFASECWFVRGPLAEQSGLKAACAFPIVVGDELVAVIEFFSCKPMVDKDNILLTITQAGTQLGRVMERERARSVLLHDALHDAMTGLPNRVLLDERSQAAFAQLTPSRAGLAVMVIDLDGFKAINDKYGHHAGDVLLIDVSRRFGATITAMQTQDTDGAGWQATLARVGGDEFVILLDGLTGPETPVRLASAMLESLREPTRVEADLVTVGASIGIAHSSAGYDDVGQIRRDADLAMYEAKAGGRDGIVTFCDELGKQARDRMAMERELRDAIRERQFVLHYQPIFTLDAAHDLRGFEALIRWNHPVRGLVEPGAFIPLAEASGLIVMIGDWVLRQACTAIARLHAMMGNRELPFVSVNIAPLQFLQPNFAAQIRRILGETGIPAECLRLEVTEGVAIIDSDRTRQVLEEVRASGVRTSLDDFGTGYSSLSYLQNLPFDTLKIDRSFIASMDDPKSRNIIRAILDLADNLNLSVVAEGIESAQQGAALVEMGCEFGQGYHLGPPLQEAVAFALAIGDRAAA